MGDCNAIGKMMRREGRKVQLGQATFSYSVADGAKWIDRQYLPEGLGDGGKTAKAKPPTAPRNRTFLERLEELDVRGFWEVRGGVRTQADRHAADASIGEARLQIQWQRALRVTPPRVRVVNIPRSHLDARWLQFMARHAIVAGPHVSGKVSV